MRLSIRGKLILSIALPLLVIAIVVFGITLNLLSKRAQNTLHDQSIMVVKNLAGRMDSQFRQVAQVAKSTASYLETFPGATKEQLFKILAANVESAPLIYGSAIAFAPYAFDKDTELFGPYVYADDEGMHMVDVARDSYDYSDGTWEWFSHPKDTGEAIWTEPFFDVGAGNILMVTHSVPFYNDGKFLGVATIDVPLDKLQMLLGIEQILNQPFVIVSSTGRFITHPDKRLIMNSTLQEEVKARNNPGFELFVENILAGKSGVGMVDNKELSADLDEGKSWVFYAPIVSTGWGFTTAVPEDVILGDLRTNLALGALGIAVMLILVIISILYISGQLTRPITKMATAVAHLSRGNLDTKIKGINSSDEIGQLALGFNHMVDQLKHNINERTRINAEREAVESEIRTAREIQGSLLPHQFPPFPDRSEFDLHAINHAANRVAGDFFDYFFIDDEHLMIIMADVSGKGVPAAMVMAVTRTIIRNLSTSGKSPADILTETNKLLMETGDQPIFVTIFLACYNTKDGNLIYANGGHNPAYRLHDNGDIEQFGEATGTIIGMLEDVHYENRETVIQHGQYMILYTDGLPEARSPDGNFYGERHFQGALRSNAGLTAKEFCEIVISEVTTFQAKELSDDITLLILKRNY